MTALSFTCSIAAHAGDNFKGDYQGKMSISVSMDDQNFTDQCSGEVIINTDVKQVEIDVKKAKCPQFKKTKESDIKLDRAGESLSYKGQPVGKLANDGSLDVKIVLANETSTITIEKVGANDISFSEDDVINDGTDSPFDTLATESAKGTLSLKK